MQPALQTNTNTPNGNLGQDLMPTEPNDAIFLDIEELDNLRSDAKSAIKDRRITKVVRVFKCIMWYT